PNRSASARGRAASCTTITAAPSGTTTRPARTEADRLGPPATATTPGGSAAPRWVAGSTATTPSQAATAAARAQSINRSPPRAENCFGTVSPNRLPDPPATTMAQTSPTAQRQEPGAPGVDAFARPAAGPDHLGARVHVGQVGQEAVEVEV